MSSGSTVPPPVKVVAIPKKTAGSELWRPNVVDRVAEMVAQADAEPDPTHLPAGLLRLPARYRAGLPWLTRERWLAGMTGSSRVLISKGLFDTSTTCCCSGRSGNTRTARWVRLDIGRWLTATLQLADGTWWNDEGTPQGGDVSPILANLFLHYASMSARHGTFLACTGAVTP